MRRPFKNRRPAIKPDKVYNSILVSKLINYVMRNGKKSTAERLVHSALEKSVLALDKDALNILETVIGNISPLLEVRSRRIGGATYQVPVEVRPERKLILALRWLVESARKRQGKNLDEILGEELTDAYNKTGSAIKKREEMHKAAEANKAFAHFARY